MAEKAKKPSIKKPAKKAKEEPKNLRVRSYPMPVDESVTMEGTGPAKVPFPGKRVVGTNRRPPIKYPGLGPDADAVISGRLMDPSEGPVGKRLPWTEPDKEVYRGQFFAPEPLGAKQLPGRRPESLGLPRVPDDAGALPLGRPESLFEFRPERYSDSSAPAPRNPGRHQEFLRNYKPEVSLPESRISSPAVKAELGSLGASVSPKNTAPSGFLDKFRNALQPAAAGATTWDPAYNPENEVPTWAKDEEASRYEERTAGNAARDEWWKGQTPEQIRENLNLSAKAQGRPGLRELDPLDVYRQVNKGNK